MLLSKLKCGGGGPGNPSYVGFKDSWNSLNTISGIQTGDIGVFWDWAVNGDGTEPGTPVQGPTGATIMRSETSLFGATGMRITTAYKFLSSTDISASSFGSGVTGTLFNANGIIVFRCPNAVAAQYYGVTGVIDASQPAGLNVTVGTNFTGPAIGFYFISADVNSQSDVDTFITDGSWTALYGGQGAYGYALYDSGVATSSQNIDINTVNSYYIQGGQLKFS